ncbi:MAG: DUF4139 domain-containing protein [Myxococcales bacterium]|nr:DUF4139 domain-containing protein [Myxococcales bacterium]
MHRWTAFTLCLAACAHGRPAAPPALRLDRVVLFQNGIGHFERRGGLADRHLRLVLRPHEVDDVIKTLTVIDRDGKAQQVAAVLPTPDETQRDRVVVDIELSRPVRDLIVSYAVPTAAWKTTYRVAMPEQAGGPLLFQAWAMIDNVSEESWDGVQLALATGAPLSFATDLRTPHFVPRPDATGAMVAPTATSVVASSSTRGGDADHDGVADVEDACPDGGEDVDGYHDDDGCPDGDNDADRIADADDRCPSEPETANGFEDDDGCPDRGRVILTSASIEILDRIYFGVGATTPGPQAVPLLDAIASTLIGNPDIRTVEIAGHASVGEDDPWGLSARRAAAVRAALAERGVQQDLTVRPFGDTLPLGRDPGANRRVEFQVLKRGDASEAPGATAARPNTQRALAAATAPSGSTVEVAGTARWQLADRVTVPRGASTLVSVLSRPVEGAPVLLFRPDAGTPGSGRHPYRAARMALPAELTVEPGPVAVFAEGSFAGEGVLARTPGGQVTYVPYAVDGGTSVAVETSGDERPQRLVAVARGVATVQNALVKKTRYTVAASASAPATIYLRHVPTAGYQLGDLPPGSERADDHVLIALPITPGKDSVLVVEERQPVTRQIELLDDATDLAAYVDGADLPAGVLAAVRAVVAARAALADATAATAAAQAALADATEHAGDLERSLATVAKLPGAEAAQLRGRLVKSLTEATGRADQLARTIATHRAGEIEARVKLQTAIEALGLEQLAAP